MSKLPSSKTLERYWTLAAWAFVFFYSLNFGIAFYAAESAGTFGDTFGAVNSAFSGASLLMLIGAVLYQRQELESQREQMEVVKQEREDTKEILKSQSQLNRDQQAALARQSFEQSLYSLLGLISDERRALEASSLIRPDHTMLGAASALATSDLWNIKDGRTSRGPREVPAEAVLCVRVCGLLVAVTQLLQAYERDTAERGLYYSAVRALIDRDLAIVWAYLILRGLSNPQAVEVAVYLKISEFCGYQLNHWVEAELQRALAIIRTRAAG